MEAQGLKVGATAAAQATHSLIHLGGHKAIGADGDGLLMENLEEQGPWGRRAGSGKVKDGPWGDGLHRRWNFQRGACKG
jgi:hypothetical protein